MKKVLHLTSVHKPFDTRIFQKQCRSLAANGYEVVLIACHDKHEHSQGVEIVPIKKPRNRFQRFWLTSFRVAVAALRQQHVDLYHIHDPELLPLGILLKFMGRTVVYDMHENVPKDILDKHWLPKSTRRLVSFAAQLIELALLPRMPVVFAETSYQKDYPFVREHCTVRNMPFLVEAGEKSLRQTVGYIGALSTTRGIDVILDAIEVLGRRGCMVDLECVGELSDDLKKELGVANRDFSPAQISWRGYLPPWEGWTYMSRCHIGLAILKPRPNFIESYPTKLFEYMSLGIPVITSSFPLYREVVESHRCGLCVDPQSPQQVADAIEWLLSHREEAAAMGRRGRRAVEEMYSWHTEFKLLQTFYTKLIAKGRSEGVEKEVEFNAAA